MTTKTIPTLLAVAMPLLTLAGPEPLIIDDKNPHHGVKWDDHRVDSHAPIGVMGEHTHDAGEAMLSYRYMFMEMRPNIDGGTELTPAQVRAQGFMVAPTDMQTQMHMLGGMYAPTDDLTLLGMVNYIDKAMQHEMMNGNTFRTATSGIGDFKFGGLLKFFDEDNQRAHFNLVASAPTGSIKETGVTPASAPNAVRLPYAMQLGSGTWDLLPGVTYLGQSGHLSWGAQLNGTLRLGRNDLGYSLGDEFGATAWTAYQFSDSVSASFRAAYKTWGNVDGADAALNPMMVPTARPDLRGGERVDLLGGLNFYLQNGPLKGHRFAIETGTTVWQDLNGPQLGMEWMTTAGWQKAF